MEKETCTETFSSNGKPECCGNEVENIVSETVCLEANSKVMLEDIYTKCAMKERELMCILENIQKIENDLSDGMEEEEKIQCRFSNLQHQKNLLYNSSDDDKIAIATDEFEATLYEKDEQIEILENILRKHSQSNSAKELEKK
ncbi:predicted protein [Chaetoceros tenuissimus]|uniref:Uncharacterized protein n=1 Tax=Chaetoceros tenuissimus TaxID=426638 RepID=A0AAD3CQ83_9STRA|nr:predicted protein [Chaetoceros tenuissimus]